MGIKNPDVGQLLMHCAAQQVKIQELEDADWHLINASQLLFKGMNIFVNLKKAGKKRG